MIRTDMERCLESLRLDRIIAVAGLDERGYATLDGIVRAVEVLPGTDPQCWRITIEDPRPTADRPPLGARRHDAAADVREIGRHPLPDGAWPAADTKRYH